MTIACSLPFHVYGYIDRHFLTDGERDGWEPCVWFGVTLPPNRAVGLTVLLECGAQYRQLPPHAFAFTENTGEWDLADAQAWDCFGAEAQAIAYTYLTELPVRVGEHDGRYLFTIEFERDGFSREPTQSKSFHVLGLENGRLTIQPNDRIRWSEASFTRPADCSWLRRQTHIWSVEEGRW